MQLICGRGVAGKLCTASYLDGHLQVGFILVLGVNTAVRPGGLLRSCLRPEGAWQQAGQDLVHIGRGSCCSWGRGRRHWWHLLQQALSQLLA